ncbi:MAG: hypothetical protein P4L83_06065 [Nevskia sp.]|nr:hypothetical protein [Nevskia sp.]
MFRTMRSLLSIRRLAPVAIVAAVLAACVSAAPSATVPAVSGCAADSHLAVGGADIRLSFDAGDFPAAGAVQICAWTGRAAAAVSDYYGRFPVQRVRIVLKPVHGSRVRGGTTFGHGDAGEPLIVIRLGREVGAEQLDDDWTMTHEMVHLAVPSVPDQSHWLEEGIATYVEPVARVRVGQLRAERIWADMLHGMPKGLPAAGDEGLDRTPTWGRTYWGGALFCLMADVEIRRRTDNRKGLRDALRGVLAAGGDIRQDWPVERVLAAGDQATGVDVLASL